MHSQNKTDLERFVEIQFNRTGSYMDIVFHHGVSIEMLNQAFVKMVEHQDFEFNINACYDYINAFPEMDVSELENHADFISQWKHRRGNNYKLALVAGDNLSAALLHVYKLSISKTPVEAEVFSRKSQAIHWLREPN